MKEKFSVTGMTCSACSAGIERSVCRLQGVTHASVSLMGESMIVEYDEEMLSREKIIDTVINLGYGASIYNETLIKKGKNYSDNLKKRFLFSLIFLLPLLYFSMGGMVKLPQPPIKWSAILQAVLALIVILINFKFFTNGTKALVKRVPNMDTLVAMGAGVSYLYSVVYTVLLFAGRLSGHVHFFYESAAMILTLVTLGKWLEEKSKRKTGEEIEKLIQLMPNTVMAERNGIVQKIPFSEIVRGDILLVKQGEYVPVDGKIIEGHSFIDRAAITGESMPIEVSEGDLVTSADIVKSGFLKILAEKVGVDTTLSQIVKMVKEAGSSKAPLQKVADKIAAVFVPIVTLIALITFFVWLVISRYEVATAANYAICVLVISCPCSLGLATPVAVMAATGRGMSLGILYKDAEALQKVKEINCVLLDKTATLTMGQPSVTEFVCFSDENFALAIAAAIESYSNHPIAECIKRYVSQENIVQKIEITDYFYEVGKGAIGKFEGKTYYLGNRRLLAGIEEKKTYSLEKEYSKEGKTTVFLSDDEKLIAVFGISDTLKQESAEAIKRLKDKKIRLGMLTGDSENVAQAIAQEIGIDDYFAECLPEDKVKAVQRIREIGGFVAMVGDGINDSPALKEADVGIAMGNGTDIAMETADVILARGDLLLIEQAIDLSKATVKNIKQNLFWAFFYNCIAIPLAAGVFAFAHVSLKPWMGAVAMCLSSLFVVTNALRLTNFQKNKEKIKEESMKKILKIEGMMCQHCVAHVTKALQGIEGVQAVEVNLKKKIATVEFATEVANDILINAVTEVGYEVKKIS